MIFVIVCVALSLFAFYVGFLLGHKSGYFQASEDLFMAYKSKERALMAMEERIFGTLNGKSATGSLKSEILD